MSTRQCAKASVPWLLVSWVIAWSMVMSQPCCYAAAARPAQQGHYAGVMDYAHHPTRNDSDTDHRGQGVSGALTTVAFDSTSAQGIERPLLPLAAASAILAKTQADATSFPIAPQSVASSSRRSIYLVTERLRI